MGIIPVSNVAQSESFIPSHFLSFKKMDLPKETSPKSKTTEDTQKQSSQASTSTASSSQNNAQTADQKEENVPFSPPRSEPITIPPYPDDDPRKTLPHHSIYIDESDNLYKVRYHGILN